MPETGQQLARVLRDSVGLQGTRAVVLDVGLALSPVEHVVRAVGGERDLASAAFGHLRSCGNRWRQVECLRLLGALHERELFSEDAERCYGRALALAEEIDAQGEIASLREALARVRETRRVEK